MFLLYIQMAVYLRSDCAPISLQAHNRNMQERALYRHTTNTIVIELSFFFFAIYVS